MDEARATQLLTDERRRLEGLLADMTAGHRDALPGDGLADHDDSAEPLTEEGGDDAVATQVREGLEAVERAEGRLAAGTYGRSVRSGEPIPDERLEAQPAAELTAAEAADTGSALRR